MLLVPTYCSACRRTALLPLLAEGAPPCADCHGASAVVPGELYRAEDEPLFQRLAAIVRSAQLSFRSASRIAAELSPQSRSVAQAELALQRIVDWQPSLYSVEPLLLAEVGQLPKGLGMLRSIVMVELREAQARSA